jgi:formamidase
VPTDEAIAREGLRTIPPRETAGNIDIKQLSPGTTVLLPVYAEGGLVSTGDVHYAQGDCEACGTAIEVRTRVHLRFGIRKGEAERRGIQDLQFFRDDYFTPLSWPPRAGSLPPPASGCTKTARTRARI